MCVFSGSDKHSQIILPNLSKFTLPLKVYVFYLFLYTLTNI